jgi:hypothetical protein
MSRRTAPIVFLAALALTGCTHASDGDDDASRDHSSERPKSGVVEVVAEGATEAAYVAGDRAFAVGSDGNEERLAGPVNTILFATLAPAAVSGPPGSNLLAYNSWRGRRPVVRVRDLEADSEQIVDEGAFSIAWRNDGTFAYAKALKQNLRSPARSPRHVVVRNSLDAPPATWTSDPGRYVVAAWAGDRLLVYRLTKTWPDLLVFDGPGRARVLAEAGALIALSPDGRRAFVSTYGAEPPAVRVLDVAAGAELATFTLAGATVPPTDDPVRFILESGSWAGDLVVAQINAGIAVFRVGTDKVALEQILGFSADVFPLGPAEPRTEAGGRRIVVWAELQGRPRQAIPPAAVVECDRLSLDCRVGRELASVPGPRLVYNPSRP